MWEQRAATTSSATPDSSQVADVDGRVVGFMLARCAEASSASRKRPAGWILRPSTRPPARRGSPPPDRSLWSHFRSKGAHVARTMVAAQDKDIAAFIAAMGFSPAPLTALEKRL